MERQIPKNVRQIGNVSDTPKIYVEDYVDTFFTQLCEKAGENPVGAFLVGDFQKTDTEEYVYIYGAIRMHELKLKGTEYEIDEDTWKRAYEDCKQYFEDGEMLGWFVAHPGVELQAQESTIKLHRKAFPKKNTIFIMRDPVEKEDAYYVHKFNDLMEIGGHYTYYEKNPCMQNYMISCRKKNGAVPTETVEDRAAKDFRSMARARGEYRQQKRSARMMYGLSACLVLVAVIMGVSMLNNFDRMKSVQTALNNLTESEESGTDSSEALETSGNVTAVIAEDDTTDTAESSVAESGAEVTADDAESASGSGTDEGQASEEESSTTSATEEGSTSENSDTDSAETNGADGVYVVEEGDTLAIISRKMYGDLTHVDAIISMNGLSDGNLIYVGQKLLLP